MLTPNDYQAMAEECFRRAREAKTDNEREDYFDLARTWLEAASSLQCSPSFLMSPSCFWRH
jgi:hypothetical protein